MSIRGNRPTGASRHLKPTQDGCSTRNILLRQVWPGAQKRTQPLYIGTNSSLRRGLSQFDSRASCFQLSFDLVSFCFRRAFFNFAASLNEVFSFFQAKTCDAANFFDDVDF